MTPALCQALLVRLGNRDPNRTEDTPCGRPAQITLQDHLTGKEAQACRQHLGTVARQAFDPVPVDMTKQAEPGAK